MDGDPRSTSRDEKAHKEENREAALEEGLDETFPASDPPAASSPLHGITGDDAPPSARPPAKGGAAATPGKKGA